jgi:2-methylcitrate dehydratase PrpD
MIGRDFVKSSLAMAALAAGSEGLADPATASPRAPDSAPFPKAPGLTKYVSEFIVNTKYGDIPAEVIELGRKSILDGFGLALAGSVSVMAPLVHQYLQGLGVNGRATIIGSSMKAPARFAAFANGISIHADDFDGHAACRR